MWNGPGSEESDEVFPEFDGLTELTREVPPLPLFF